MSKLQQLVALYLAGVISMNSGFAQDFRSEGSSRVLVWMPGVNRTALISRESFRRRVPNARFFDSIPIAAVRLTPAERSALEAELGPGHIFEDREFRTSLFPSTTISGIPYVWDSGYTGKGQSVAVIDTGINPMHPTFLGVNIVSKVFLNSGKEHPCFGDDASSGNDLQGHGTRTSSIIASQAVPLFPNYFGAARGVGTLYSMKAGFRAKPGSACPIADGVLLASDILAAMEFIANQTDAKVVNLSLGSNAETDDDPLARIFDYFVERYGLTLVFAAGNRGTEAGIQTPGISYNGLTVANVDDKGTEDKRDDTIHPSSTRGPTVGQRSKPDIAASGTRIYAAEFNSSGFNTATGTSAASPLVAGAAVLLRDAGVNDALSIKALLLNSTDGDGIWQRDWGWGNLNAAAAFDQRRNVLTGSVPAKSSRFFRGTFDGPFRAMLVWNRHPDVSSPTTRSPLFELSLTVYKRDGSLAAQSDSPRDNVEQVRIDSPNGGEFVVRVEAPASVFGLGVVNEDFALAATRAGLSATAGPSWEMRCSMPSSVAVGATFTANCTAENTGDLDLFRVTGSLLVPQGFGGGGPQNFGNLAPGQTRTLQWPITAPSNGGSFSSTTAGTASSYGVAVEYSSVLPRIDVGGSGLTLDPAVVTLSPSTSSAQVRAAGTLTLQSGAAWYRLSQASGGSFTVSLTEAGRSLAAGRYESQYTASSGGLTSRGTVVLAIPVVGPAVESARVAFEARIVSGCPVPLELRSVSDAISPVYWFVARGVTARDLVTVRWISPGGSVIETMNLPSAAAASCFSASFDLKRVDVTKRFGEWKVEAAVNGIRQSVTSFTVNPALQLISGVCEDVQPNPSRIPVCPRFRGTSEATGQALRLEFLRPDGEVDGLVEASWAGANQFAYAPVVESSGVWRVRVFADGAPAGTLEIPVAASFQLGRADLVDNRLEFAIERTAEGTKGRLELVNPAGAVFETRDLEFPEATVELPELAELGRWRIRLFWDDILLRTIPFDRFAGRILEQGLTAESRQPLCSGTPATLFSVLDSQARFWVRLDKVVASARLTMEFWQSGEARARADFEVLPAGGGSCLSASLPVSGSLGGRNSGAWEARVFLNGVELSRTPFEIRRDGTALQETAKSAPLSGSVAILAVRGESSQLP